MIINGSYSTNFELWSASKALSWLSRVHFLYSFYSLFSLSIKKSFHSIVCWLCSNNINFKKYTLKEHFFRLSTFWCKRFFNNYLTISYDIYVLECDRFSLLCHFLCIIWTVSVIVHISKPWLDKERSASKLTRNQYDQTSAGFDQINHDRNSVTSILEQTPECVLVDPSCFDGTLGG